MTAAIKDALRQMPLFAKVADEQKLLQILEQGTEIWLEPGETLRGEGDPGEFFVLLQGELQVIKRMGDRETVLVVHRSGTFFGEVPLLLDMPFVVSGRALSQCHLFCLDKHEFWQMLGRPGNPIGRPW